MITIFTSGNVGADAELQVTPKGKAVANFRLGARNRGGETEWLRCQLWGDRAEKLCPFLKKGTRVEITGYPEAYGWQDKETGEIRTVLTIQVNDLDFGSAVGGPKRHKVEAENADVEAPVGKPSELGETVEA
jgi:single-strand DNA-binding protein